MTTRRRFKGSLYEGGLPLTAPVLLISMLAGYETFSRTVDASIRGEDYPEGHLTRPDPLERCRFPLGGSNFRRRTKLTAPTLKSAVGHCGYGCPMCALAIGRKVCSSGVPIAR